jgi:predicted RNA binding protein with dsRBD fold (UPF0201 family)
MNVKLKRVNDEINKIETRISEWQNQLKLLKQQRKQLEDQEIIKAIRSMQLEGMDMVYLLDGIQKGSIVFTSDDEGDLHMEQRNDAPDQGATSAAESEDNNE